MSGLLRTTALMFLLAGVALTAGQTPGGQPAAAPQGPESPTFRVQVDYVEVDAFVTDGQGRFIRDLKKEDFQVFEDGKRRRSARSPSSTFRSSGPIGRSSRRSRSSPTSRPTRVRSTAASTSSCSTTCTCSRCTRRWSSRSCASSSRRSWAPTI